MDKIKVSKVTILWAEGPIAYSHSFPREFDSCTEASNFLRSQTHFPDMGYDKHKFRIDYEDGEEYVGRLDCTEKYDDCDIKQHILEVCEYYKAEHPELGEFPNKYDLN